jgi:aryl-alcohol dehydrogenase-like predicted oxidoreductase
MSGTDLASVLNGARLMPVLTVPSPATAGALADALAKGGARCAEVTFRTPVGMNQSEMPARFLRETAADVVMPAGRYTLLDQSALDDVLSAAQELGKTVVAVGVFNSGLLSSDRPAEGMKYDYRDAPPDVVDRARAIAVVCERHGTILPAAAIAFPLTHPAVINVTLGVRSPDQVARNVKPYRRRVPEVSGMIFASEDSSGRTYRRETVTEGVRGVPDGQGDRADPRADPYRCAAPRHETAARAGPGGPAGPVPQPGP